MLITVDKYEVYAICEFILASTLFSVNKKVRHTCFKCNHKFQDDDAIYLGFLKKHKNEIFCEKCASQLPTPKGRGLRGLNKMKIYKIWDCG